MNETIYCVHNYIRPLEMSTAAELFLAASSARAAGDLRTAAASYASAIALTPTMAEAYINNGWVLS